MASEEENKLFATQERLAALKEIDNVSQRGVNLAKAMADFAKEEYSYRAGIEKDLRSSEDISKKIATLSLKAKAAEKEKMNLFRKGKIDAAIQLGLLAKDTKERIKQLGLLNEKVKKQEELKKKTQQVTNVNKKIQKGADTFLASTLGTASLWGIIKNAILESSKLSTGLQKTLGVSDTTANSMMKNFQNMADSIDKQGISGIALQKSFMGLNEELGTASQYIRQDILQETVELTKFMGLSNKEAASFAQFSLISGKNMNSVTKDVEKQVKVSMKEKGIRMSFADIMKKTAAVTGQVRAQLGANPAAIAKAVVLAKQFGMELSQVAKSADSLLNFEQSIEKELEAELLTGKQLNLEKARLYALTGDYEGLTRELNKNIGTYSDFMSMNVLQQRALAEAHGLSVDELSEMLIGERSLEELAAEARAAGQEDRALELEDEAKKRDLAQQFSDLQESLQTILINNQGSIKKFVEFMISLVDNAGVLKAILIGVGAIKLTGMITQLGTMLALNTANAAAASTAASASTLGIGSVAIIAAVTAIMAAAATYGVMNMAEGGIVMPRAGGTIARIGEAGQAEAVIPLNKASQMGFGADKETKDILSQIARFTAQSRNVSVTTVHDAFGSKNTNSEGGDFSSDVKYDVPFA